MTDATTQPEGELAGSGPRLPHDATSRSVQLTNAWRHVDRASETLGALARAWNSACPGAYSAYVSADSSGLGEIVVELDFDQDTRDLLNRTARDFGRLLRQALDDGVVTLARLVSGVLVLPDPAVVQFPLAATFGDFLTAYRDGALDGIRPDQGQFVERLQPFNDYSPASPALEFLRQLTEQPPADDVVVAYAHSARPVVFADPPSTAEILAVDPDGPITTTKRIATFQLATPADRPSTQHPSYRGNPDVAFDLVATVGSDPANGNDTFERRARFVLGAVTLILEAIERSIGLRPGSVDSWDPLKRLSAAQPTGPSWAPLQADQERAGEAANAAQRSETGIATVGDGRELTLVIRDGDGVHLRRVPAATALDPRLPRGPAAEDATTSAAARWGLRDFVFPPVKRTTGSGVREIGDGIVLAGGRGLILQVKSRDNAGDKAERETSWITKKAAEAAGQAAGTLRQLRLQPASLKNQRGREILVDGNTAAWIGVVIIDHPAPPQGVTLPVRHKGLVVVTLLRRDWEFLFEQLGSTSAVIAYLHRVGDDPCELGDEPARYYDLAAKDAEAEPNTPINGWAAEIDAPLDSRPILPRIPATATHGPGRDMFRTVLEDLADTRIDDENQRLALMALLDQTPVGYQSDVGERLLQMLKDARQVTPGNCSWGFRWICDTQHPLQVAFGVSNQLSKWHTEAFRGRLLLQHHRITRHPWGTDDEPTSVGVLLTPNYYLRDRLWDTTVLATFGPSELEAEDVTAYEDFWERRR